jgi:hypothetical protein
VQKNFFDRQPRVELLSEVSRARSGGTCTGRKSDVGPATEKSLKFRNFFQNSRKIVPGIGKFWPAKGVNFFEVELPKPTFLFRKVSFLFGKSEVTCFQGGLRRARTKLSPRVVVRKKFFDGQASDRTKVQRRSGAGEGSQVSRCLPKFFQN